MVEEVLIKDGVYYKQIIDTLKTFDMIGFRGGEMVSDVISFIQDSLLKNKNYDYTHVGICIKGNSFPTDHKYFSESNTYIFESTQSGSIADGVNNVDGKSFLGVQLRNFSDVIEAYDKDKKTKICICRLIDYPEKTPKEIAEIVDRYNGAMYDFSPLDLTSAAFRCLRPLRNIVNKICKCRNRMLFCSELVANIYKDAGILPKDINPENVLPLDFFTNPIDIEDIDDNFVERIIQLINSEREERRTTNKTMDADNAIPIILCRPIVITAFPRIR